MSAITLNHVSKSWGAMRAVDDINLTADEGSLLVLLGPSGCGKSTTLRLIAGLEEADAGTIAIGGVDVTRLSPADRKISMVFQSYALFPHLSVAENIIFGLRVRRVSRAERDARLRRVADIVGLAHLLDRKPSQLSEGSASASRWHAPSSPRRGSVSWTSRFPTWTPSCGTRCERKSARCSSALP